MDTTDPKPGRRRWLFLAIAVAVLFALALTPPYLNVNRLQRRIAASMSEALGRPVHLDSVTLHLLPLPGFTLENLVVSEDAAFGAEPVIRANTVEITLRLRSLWRRQVEVSSIRFVEPSLNLVRNTEGRWNLQSLLMHAAAAAQPGAGAFLPSSRAGEASRRNGAPAATQAFPYIEATGARVNVKLGDEKKPFSLTEADFALWLPNPTTWQLRLEGKPARTDLNISDPGTIKLEGSLQRAAGMSEVPVALNATWEGAPLGEASLLLSGADAGWRGKLTVNARLTGKLGAAALTGSAHFEGLRRADFVPARTLDLTTACAGTLDLTTAIVNAPACTLTTPDSKAPLANAVSSSVDLSRLTQAETLLGLRIGSPALPESFILDAARLFSQRIPTSATAAGTLTASATLTATGFVLEPTNLQPEHGTPLLLDGLATAQGYTLHVSGPIAPAEMSAVLTTLPPLADGLPELAKPGQLDLTCTRLWHGTQSCTQVHATEAVHKKRHR